MKKLKTLILIDDDEIVEYLTKKLVEKTNVVELINVFKNGKEAIDYLKENLKNTDSLPEIIFLDLFMPVMDGWKFLEEYIKIDSKLDKKISIFIISSSVSSNDIIKAKEYSVVSNYIIKPITKEHFLEIIRSI